MIISYLNFYLSKEGFTSASPLKDIVTGHKSVIFLFITLQASLHCFCVYMVSNEKSVVNLSCYTYVMSIFLCLALRISVFGFQKCEYYTQKF